MASSRKSYIKAPATLIPNTEGLDSLNGSKNHVVVLLLNQSVFQHLIKKIGKFHFIGVKLFLKTHHIQTVCRHISESNCSRRWPVQEKATLIVFCGTNRYLKIWLLCTACAFQLLQGCVTSWTGLLPTASLSKKIKYLARLIDNLL